MRVEKYDFKNAEIIENEEGIKELSVGVFQGNYTYDDEGVINGFEITGEVIDNKVASLEYINNAIEECTPDGQRLPVWEAFKVKYEELVK